MLCLFPCVWPAWFCGAFLYLVNLSLQAIWFDIFTVVCSRPGGDKIYNVFDNQLPAALKRLQFDKQLSMENIRKLITEADGYQPHLIAPEQGYRRLIESSVVTIRGPAEAAVDAVCMIFKNYWTFLGMIGKLNFFCCFLLHVALVELMLYRLCCHMFPQNLTVQNLLIWDYCGWKSLKYL